MLKRKIEDLTDLATIYFRRVARNIVDFRSCTSYALLVMWCLCAVLGQFIFRAEIQTLMEYPKFFAALLMLSIILFGAILVLSNRVLSLSRHPKLAYFRKDKDAQGVSGPQLLKELLYKTGRTSVIFILASLVGFVAPSYMALMFLLGPLLFTLKGLIAVSILHTILSGKTNSF